jgi:hypothetical protein
VIKVATKKHKEKQLYKRENIKETDIIEEGRTARSRTTQDYKALATKHRIDG